MYISEVYGKNGIYAKVVLASVANSIPIYTLEVAVPKFLDAEFEKHRMLSSGSSSSRAIPFKQPEEVFFPFDIRKNQKGMQGYEKVEDFNLKNNFIWDLDEIFRNTIDILLVYKDKIHKQHLNRYIEPWTIQKKVVTGTEWLNFFFLRAPKTHWGEEEFKLAELKIEQARKKGNVLTLDNFGGEMAQPEMQELTRCMKDAIREVTPTTLLPGQWHLPYVDCSKKDGEYFSLFYNTSDEDFLAPLPLEIAKACSSARCARVSYNNHDKSDPNIEKDLILSSDLLSSMHLTPFEHQATPMQYEANYNLYGGATEDVTEWENGITHIDRNGRYWSGNFYGWIQNRQLMSSWNEKEL